MTQTALPALVKDGHYWTEESKATFLLEYVKTGNLRKTSELFGLSYETALLWSKQDWFIEQRRELDHQKTLALTKQIEEVRDLAIEQMRDRIANGEDVTLKDGKIVKRKANLASLTIAAGTLFDKTQVLKKNPVQVDTSDDILIRIADKLRDLAQKPRQGEIVDADFRESPA